jgi:hypothetical protein
MAQPFARKAAIAIASALAMTATFAADMSREQRKAAEDRIEADYKAAKAACDGMKAEAKGKQKVAKAELDFQASGKDADRSKVVMARAEANYELAKEKCDDLKGNDKDVCVKQAKAAETKAKADAKASKQTSEARKDAAEDKRDAEYKAARERCDSMSGDAKDSCVAQVKSRYGKG